MTFEGFPKETLRFLAELEIHNHKGWFDDNRDRYEKYVLEMARSFVEAMEEPLGEIDGGIVVDPRVNKSMFRINRDVRFNPEKPPYKPHIACLFWNERGKRMKAPGYYFHLEPDQLLLGGGSYQFPKDFKEPYREAVASDEGEELEDILSDLISHGYDIEGGMYKRMPSGYDADHPRADLLKRKGLIFSWSESPPPESVHSAEITDYVSEHYARTYPLIDWLSRAMFES
jgi:uncharacterized protein (TIGR02453 family)